MFNPILGKTIFDLRIQIFGWGIGMGLLALLIVLVYPSISSTYGDIMKEMPEGMMAFFGGNTSLHNFEGYLSQEFFNPAPLALAVFAILSGSQIIVGEESQGTLELILVQPISRFKVFIFKALGLLIANGAIIFIMLVIFSFAVLIADVEVNTTRILNAFLLLWPFLATLSFLSMLLSLLFSSRIVAGTVMAVLIVSSFILHGLSNLVSWLEAYRHIYITAYFQGRNALTSEVSSGHIITLLVVLAAISIINLYLFVKRDIGVAGSISLPTLRKKYTSK
ncbi:hypothetical protein FIM04_03635 [SAR202 cluster bacterium AC-409-J13_OGT_754m]|nr:hypothetical protein [SAR202 cluster bacterium AC-409-J13_OGT_754m]